MLRHLPDLFGDQVSAFAGPTIGIRRTFFLGRGSICWRPEAKHPHSRFRLQSSLQSILLKQRTRTAFEEMKTTEPGPTERAGRDHSREKEGCQRTHQPPDQHTNPWPKIIRPAAAESPGCRLDSARSGEIPAKYRRTEFDPQGGLGQPRTCHSKRGTTSTASAATGRLPTHWHSMTRDRRGCTLPVAAVPHGPRRRARTTRAHGATLAERHDSPAMRRATTSGSGPLGSTTTPLGTRPGVCVPAGTTGRSLSRHADHRLAGTKR